MLTQKLQTLASAEESFKTCGPETVHVGGTAHIMSSIYAVGQRVVQSTGGEESSRSCVIK